MKRHARAIGQCERAPRAGRERCCLDAGKRPGSAQL